MHLYMISRAYHKIKKMLNIIVIYVKFLTRQVIQTSQIQSNTDQKQKERKNQFLGQSFF